MVYLIGAGPGDPELITVRGRECLGRADVVVYDYLADRSLLDHVPSGAERIYVGKRAGRHTMKQDEINELLVRKSREGGVVVRLKGGDPFVFGRGGEECEVLREHGCGYEVVPGVTAGVAAPACAGIPVTHRADASSVAFITGHEDPRKGQSAINWEHLARGVDTLVFYMGVGNLESIARRLIDAGREPDTPAACIRWGTKPAQETVSGTLESIAGEVSRAGLRPPAVTVVGSVCALREKLAWFEKRPLFGRRIVNTRSRTQASRLSGPLRELGAEVIELPTIAIEPDPPGGELDRSLERIDTFDWIVFTSPNAVSIFFERLLGMHGDVRALGRARIAAIGPGTGAAIAAFHLRVDIVARRAVAEGLVDELRGVGDWSTQRVLLPRAAKAREVLPEFLRGAGADVVVVPAYTTRPTEGESGEVVNRILDDEYDCITFTSSSTVEHFAEMVGEEDFCRVAPALRAAAIGPITASTLRSRGVEPLVEAREHTLPGLVAALKEYYES